MIEFVIGGFFVCFGLLFIANAGMQAGTLPLIMGIIIIAVALNGRHNKRNEEPVRHKP